MVDFKRLLDQSPEEREKARNAAQAAFEERINGVIDTRMRQVAQLQKLQGLGTWEAGFVEHMRSLAHLRDAITGRVGGRLAYLTDSQVASLEKLVARTQQSTRAQRYGSMRSRS